MKCYFEISHKKIGRKTFQFSFILNNENYLEQNIIQGKSDCQRKSGKIAR